MKNTHAKTHSNYTVEIGQLFRVSREGEVDQFKKVKSHVLISSGPSLWKRKMVVNALKPFY